MNLAFAMIASSTLVVLLAASVGCDRKKKPESRPAPAPVYLVLPPIAATEPSSDLSEGSASPVTSSSAQSTSGPVAAPRSQELSPEAWLQRAAVAAWSGERDRERTTRSFESGAIEEPDEGAPGEPQPSGSVAAPVSSADIQARVDALLAEEREKQRAAELEEKRVQEARRQEEQRLEAKKLEAEREAARKWRAATYGAGPGFTGIGGGGVGFTGIGAGASTFTGAGAGASGFTGYGAGSSGFTGTGANAAASASSGYSPGVFTGPVYWPLPAWWIPTPTY